MARLAKRRHIRVVIHRDSAFHQRCQPFAQGKIGPPCDMMRTTDPAGLMVDRPAEPDAHPCDLLADSVRCERCLDIALNTGGSFPTLNGKTAAIVNVPILIAKDDLKFSASDFDACQ